MNTQSNDALLCVTREIEAIKKKLAALSERKRELDDKAKTIRWSAKKVVKAAKHQLWLEMLEMAAKGMSLREIAEVKGVSKHNMQGKLTQAWYDEFPAHFNANWENEFHMGFLSKLRDSPPLFISSKNDQVEARRKLSLNSTDRVAVQKTGRFMAKQPSKSGKGTHDHKWIFGAENAVCTKCGYTLPKTTNLPTRGLHSPENVQREGPPTET